MTTSVHRRTCPLCEAMCGLEVQVKDGAAGVIRGDRNDVWSKGYICPKGTTLGHLYHDPDRLREPLVREGTTWREVSWADAFARCEELIHGVIERHGKSALTTYIGNPVAHGFALSRGVAPFITFAGLSPIYSAGTIDQWPKNVVCHLMYGRMWQIAAPDIARTDYWLVMGANPQASQGSLLAIPDILAEIDAIRDRGGKTVVVDPRRTGTAEKADEWIPIQPGTDAAFLLAILNVLVDEGRTTLGDLADIVNGMDDVVALVRDWTPELVAATCRVPAATTRRIAREIAAAPRAAVYGRIGLCNQEFGTLASWLIDVINIVTGNFDVPGGLMFGNPVALSLATMPNPALGPHPFGRFHSRVRGAPEVLGQFPVSCLAEEIDTPGDGQIRGLIIVAGNPVLSTPDTTRLDAALPLLDAMISVDNWLNETTRHAHVILPGLAALEQPHLDDLIWSWASRSAIKWSDAVFPPEPGRPDEFDVLLTLAGLCMGQTAAAVDVRALDDMFFTGLVSAFGLDAEQVVAAHGDLHGAERLSDFCIRMGPWGEAYGKNPDGLTLAGVQAAPNGLDFGPPVPRVRELLATPSGKIELAPPYITSDLPRLRARLDRNGDGLVLVSRRHLRSNNSWMHNVKVLVKGKDRCTLLIHPDDAAAAGVADGELANVTSEIGSIAVTVEVTDEMMPGVVCLPHGWGHDKDGTRLSVAREHAGVNNNVLLPGHLVDAISGNAVANGIPVEVVAASA
jgi:anaerobic selenocysteine-containing dehydrogenase